MKAPVFKPGKNNSGFTIVEMVITIVVLGIALAGVSSALFTAVGRSANPMVQNKAVELAQAYLDEILSMRFQEDSPLGGGTVGSCSISTATADSDGSANRSDFDDVDDYNGLNEVPAFLAGTVPSDYAGFNVSVTVSCINQSGAASTNSKHILLNITGPANTSISMAAYRGDF